MNATPTVELEELLDSVSGLTSRQRDVVVLVYACGLSLGDTAHALGIAPPVAGAALAEAYRLIARWC